jgi:hypothetical protein
VIWPSTPNETNETLSQKLLVFNSLNLFVKSMLEKCLRQIDVRLCKIRAKKVSRFAFAAPALGQFSEKRLKII